MHQTSVCLSVYTRLLSTGSTRANKVASIGLTTFRVNAKHLIRNRRNCLKDTLYFDRAHCDRIRCERSVVATKERKKASEGGGRGIYGTRMACAFASTKWQSEDRLTAREGRKEGTSTRLSILSDARIAHPVFSSAWARLELFVWDPSG